MELTRLPKAPFGLQIGAVDIAAGVDAATIAEIAECFAREGVVVLRGQRIDSAGQVAFSRCFGELEVHFLRQFLHPQHPEILVVSNIVENGRPLGQADAGRYWHSDTTYALAPSRGSVMLAVEVPRDQTGTALGDTCFASAALAWEHLDPALQRRVAGLRAVHRFDARYRRGAARVELDEDQSGAQTDVEHPVVIRHPVTGRRALYVNELFTLRVSGLPEAESAALLTELCAHITRPEFVYRHNWREGDVLCWDNFTVQHLAIGDYGDRRRRMQKTTWRGAAPAMG